MPIAQLNSFARVSINKYCRIYWFRRVIDRYLLFVHHNVYMYTIRIV